MSEEPQEARNKHFKKFRADYSRKFSRRETLRDVFNRFLITSDPFYFYIFCDFNKSRIKKNRPRKQQTETLLTLLEENKDVIDSDTSDSDVDDDQAESISDIEETHVDAV